MKILLIGKNGQLGWELQRGLQQLGEVIALGRNELDLAASDFSPTKISAFQPDIIINASAYTEVDQAESQLDLAMSVNARAPGILAELAHQLGAVLIHYSTDYVFDGMAGRPYTENDTTNPINVYGQSKLLGEQNIQQAADSFLILRTSWVYSSRGNSFVNKVLTWSRNNTNLRIVNDQIGNPTWARGLALVTVAALEKNRAGLFEKIKEQRGIYHLAGSGYTSRLEWAQEILASDPKPEEQMVQTIEPASTADFPTAAKRPLFSALDCAKFAEVFDLRLPAWKESLRSSLAPDFSDPDQT